MSSAVRERVPDVDPGSLSHAERIALLIELERVKAAAEALTQRTLTALAADDGSLKEWVREEVACALRVAPATAAVRLADARELCDLLPATVTALADGVIGFWHARALAESTRVLDADVRARVEDRVLRRAGEQTSAQFRASVRRAVARLDPRGEDERQDTAVAGRRVAETRHDDGTAEVWALLPVCESARIMARVRERARLLGLADRGAICPRTLDQRRADALAQLVLGTPAPTGAPVGRAPGAASPAVRPDHGSNVGSTTLAPGASRPTGSGTCGYCGEASRSAAPVVQLIMPWSTLAGATDGGAELAGYGPIGTDLARHLAADADARWQPVALGPDGRPERVAPSYRPSAALRRLVATRDRTCRFPGCRRRAEACELDHVVPWEDGGPTTEANLHALCGRHHHLKHEAPGWRVDRDDDGTTTWTTPTRHSYPVRPDDRDDVVDLVDPSSEPTRIDDG